MEGGRQFVIWNTIMGTKYENETHICRIIENLQLEMVYKITNQYIYTKLPDV